MPGLTHIQHQLVTMVTVWDWHTCYQWSETVFTMVSNGCLPKGWSDHYVIKDVQRDVCAVGTRIHPVREVPRPNVWPTAAVKRQDLMDQQTPLEEKHAQTDYNWPMYNADTDGKPCHQWNCGSDCEFSTSRRLQPAR